MDLLKFINSNDIRNHLEKIGYEFNSLEAAWLIYQCRNATVTEKHKAWNELTETMPDCRIEERWFTPGRESLHEFLKKYMELEDKYINDFCNGRHTDTTDGEKPDVYTFESSESIIRVFVNYESAQTLFNNIIDYIYSELFENYYDTMAEISVENMYGNFVYSVYDDSQYNLW